MKCPICLQKLIDRERFGLKDNTYLIRCYNHFKERVAVWANDKSFLITTFKSDYIFNLDNYETASNYINITADSIEEAAKKYKKYQIIE